MEYESLKLDISDKIALLTLSQPETYNSMKPIFWVEMIKVFNKIEKSNARVVIINAEGKHFTSGLDLNEFSSLNLFQGKDVGRIAENIRKIILELQESFNVIEKSKVPVIAAIQGACIGGGVDLISACDMRYCTFETFFSIHEVKIGMTADMGTLQRLPNLIPNGLMRELAYTGRKMYAEEALKAGLINKIYPDKKQMLSEVKKIAEKISLNSPIAVSGTKKILKYSQSHSIEDSLEFVATWNSSMLQSADFFEAIKAQNLKRNPIFEDIKKKTKLLK